MIENSMFYMDFEISSEQQRECIEKIKEATFYHHWEIPCKKSG